MKGGKDEKKLMAPLFPRLHIRDFKKGGPRAPPRNKMAISETLTAIPSPNFNSGSASRLHLPPINPGNLVSSVSSTHDGGQEMGVFSPVCTEGLHSFPYVGVNLNSTLTNLQWLPAIPANYQTLGVTGHLKTTTAEHSFNPMLGLSMSPDDVAYVMGQKHFLEAKTAILCQQRMFATQVFELHRLTEVQRLIARSPDLWSKNYLCLGQPPIPVAHTGDIASQHCLILKPQDDPQNMNLSTFGECPACGSKASSSCFPLK